MLDGAEQREEVKVESFANLDQFICLHCFPFQYAVDVLLGHTNPSPKFRLADAKLLAPVFYRVPYMYGTDFYIHMAEKTVIRLNNQTNIWLHKHFYVILQLVE